MENKVEGTDSVEAISKEELEKFFGPSPEMTDEEKMERVRKRYQRLKAQNAAEEEKLKALQPYAFKLFDRQDVQKKLTTVARQKDSQELQSLLKKMNESGGRAYLVPQPTNYDDALNRLLKQYPHFENVIDHLRKRMRLNGLKKYPVLDFGGNILLNGPAGCGKSSFLMEMSDMMQTKFLVFSAAAMSAGFELTGMSSGWGGAKNGKLHDIIVMEACPNPIILIDEVDKMETDHNRHNFASTLYGLLEKNNAERFRDEYVDVQIDASRVNWVASSNDYSRLPDPIRDRFEAIEVSSPNQNDLRKIIPQVYRKTVINHELQSVFSVKLAPDVIDRMLLMNSGSIRRLKSMIEDGLANAAPRAKAGRKISLQVDDVPADMSSEPQRQKIGFIH